MLKGWYGSDDWESHAVSYLDEDHRSDGATAARVGGRVLVVDDDAALRALLLEFLTDAGFDVVLAADGRSMRDALEASAVDLVILDVSLPDESGLALAGFVRHRTDAGIIMLTAHAEPLERIAGLELGADDYIAKPFVLREVLARVRAVLRRRTAAPVAAARPVARGYRFAGFELRTGTRRLTTPGGARVELTNAEYSLLLAFVRQPRQTLARHRLLDLSRLHADEIFDRTVDVQVFRLRRRLETDPGAPRLIVTERSVGYRLQADVEVVHQ